MSLCLKSLPCYEIVKPTVIISIEGKETARNVNDTILADIGYTTVLLSFPVYTYIYLYIYYI
jgi:hypothetical protein